eukprot:2013571-Prymnesium_polylepis.1
MLVGLTIPSGGDAPHMSTAFLRTDAFEGALAAGGDPKYPEFGTPRRGGGGWWVMLLTGDPTDNASVNVVRLPDGAHVAMTETARGTHRFDPATLASLGRYEWAAASDRVGQLQTAHPLAEPDGSLVIGS